MEIFDEWIERLVGLQILALLFVLAHYTACFWHFIGQPDDGSSGEAFAAATQATWVTTELEDSASLSERYAASLYWASTALTTVGFSDITASTIQERFYTVFVQFLGTIAVGYSIGMIASTMVTAKLNPQTIEKKRKMAMVNEYMRQKGFDRLRTRQIRSVLCAQFDMKTTDEEAVLQLMPPLMRRETIRVVYKELIAEMLFFKGLDDAVTADMLAMLRPQLVPEGEIVCAEGEASEEIFIVQSGMLQVSCRGKDLGWLRRGSFFGEVAALGLGSGAEGRTNSRTVVAKQDSHLSYFTAESIDALCRKHPALAARLDRHVELRKYKEDIALRAEKWAMVVPTEQDARNAFERIDADKSNSLSRKELAQILTVDFGLVLSDEELEDAFAELVRITLRVDCCACI
eukprot:COSAG03_NODE_125_length_12157_cov_186.920965_6_plen_403_part_00